MPTDGHKKEGGMIFHIADLLLRRVRRTDRAACRRIITEEYHEMDLCDNDILHVLAGM
jgi:hypothetical protein